MQTKLQELSERLFAQQRTKPVETSRQRGLMYGHSDVELGLKMLIEGLEIYLRGQRKEYRKDLTEELRPIAEVLNGLLSHRGQFDSETCREAIRLIIKVSGEPSWKE